MGLKKFLAEGLSVVGSKFDGKIRNMKDMTESSQKRHGYLGSDGFWTDKGWNRATSADLDAMAKANRANAKNKRNQGK